MSLELVSFKLCPFVQRSVITLLYKNVDFKITHIDLDNPPDWFKRASPFGKVPLLVVNGDTYIFESAVINEYLDETTPGRMLPDDPLLRAKDRSWIGFGSAMIMDISGIMHADSEEKYEKKLAALTNKFGWLEGILETGPYFNGSDISLVDCAYAPLFLRMQILGLDESLLSGRGCKKVRQWSDTLLAMDCVKNSVVPDFEDLLIQMVKTYGPYAAQKLDLKS